MKTRRTARRRLRQENAPTIVVTGGGSGGHITPILAVAAELKRQRPGLQIVYVGQTGDGLGDIPAADANIDHVYTVRAGKFRRYHGEGIKQLFDLPTVAQNLRDLLWIVTGLWQSYWLLRRLKPQVVFTRGGYVSVPVALGARLNGVAYLTHDSDPIPSLANRLIAPWAAAHAVALPKEMYPYPAAKTMTTGIPLQGKFQPVSATLKHHYRSEIALPADAQLVFVIGGGLGSQRVNAAVLTAAQTLLPALPRLYIIHVVGRANQTAVEADYTRQLSPAERARVQVYGYLNDVYRYSGAADVVVSRAGATNLAEFALQAKACVVIPSPFLTGGHQLKNAQYLAEQGAIITVAEQQISDDASYLATVLADILGSPDKQRALAEQLSQFATPAAAHDVAQLILKIADKKGSAA